MFSLLLLKPIRIYSTLLHTEFTQAAIIIAWGDPYKFYSIHIDLTTCCIWLVVVFTQRPGHRTDTRGRHRPQGEIWWQIQHLASVLSCITLQPTAFPHNSWGRNHRIRIAEVGKVPQVHPVQPLNVTAQPLLFSFTSSFSGFNYKRNSFFFFFLRRRGERTRKKGRKSLPFMRHPQVYEVMGCSVEITPLFFILTVLLLSKEERDNWEVCSPTYSLMRLSWICVIKANRY